MAAAHAAPDETKTSGHMTRPAERQVVVGGHPHRILESGSGDPLVFFAGVGGLPRWIPFLEKLAATRRVIVPSLPGFPGASEFRHLDEYYDWVMAALELLERLGVEPVDLIGSSVGGALAAELAAVAPQRIRRLVLVAPFGIYDDRDPSTDIWAQPPGPDSLPQLLCQNPQAWDALWELPEGEDPVEWRILLGRAMEAAARYLFPMGDTRILRRLYRVAQPTLLIRGVNDRIMPRSYQERFAAAISGPVTRAEIQDAGHLAELDAPENVALRIDAFLTDRVAAG